MDIVQLVRQQNLSSAVWTFQIMGVIMMAASWSGTASLRANETFSESVAQAT
jgi:hypothetical protein